MRDENYLYWIWLADKFGIASKEFPSFADKFDDPYDVYRMTEEEIGQIDGLSERMKDRLGNKAIDEAYSILKYCKKNKIDIIGYGDDRYPSRLKTIENPPVLLYCMGMLPDIDSNLCIAMVGTRRMSEYGKQTAYKISYELAAAGVCIVSGMALGIDAVCACGALESGGQTVAVLGSGLSVIYPKEHDRLMSAIARRGAVISEYPPFERPLPQNFPRRNRIISALSQGVVVVEGAHGSGALITASKAVSQGRELFAIPGKVNESNSDGPNELIRNGANVILSADDIISHYDFLYHDTINYRAFSASKKKSGYSDGALRSYGVSSYSYGRASAKSTADGAQSKPKRTEKPTDTPIASPEPKVSKVSHDSVEKPKKSSENTLLDTVDDITREIYGHLPDGESFSPDALVSKGFGIGQIMTSLTILEISGLVTSLPGGVYKKV